MQPRGVLSLGVSYRTVYKERPYVSTDDIHAVVLIIVVIIRIWVMRVRPNPESKYVLDVNAKRNGRIYPPPLLAACRSKPEPV
jgi:hypothetical protein